MSWPSWNACSSAGILRQVRHDAQLDLRIVGGDEHVSRRRDERLANAPSFRRAHRDVLQIGIVRREAAGHRGRLPERRVHASRLRVHHQRQLVGVRRLELRRARDARAAPWAADSRRRAPAALPRRSTAVRSPSSSRTGSFIRWNRISQICLGEPRLNGSPGELVRLLLERQHALAELLAMPGRAAAASIEDAVALHAEQHVAHRQLELRVDEVELGDRPRCAGAARGAGAA